MTALDEQRWYCYKDDLIFFPKENLWSDDQSAPVPATTPAQSSQTVGTLNQATMRDAGVEQVLYGIGNVCNTYPKKRFINIENVIGTVSLRHGVKIDSAIKAFPSPDYKPGVRVSKVVDESMGKVLLFLTDQPKLAILISESGKIVCTGPKSVTVAHDCLLEILNDIRIRGIKTPNDTQFQVQNIVASAGLGGAVHLEMCVKKLKRTTYEPKQFPGVIYRMDDPKVVAMIFASGKLVLTGAKSENEVHRSVVNLEVTLRDKKLITYLAD